MLFQVLILFLQCSSGHTESRDFDFKSNSTILDHIIRFQTHLDVKVSDCDHSNPDHTLGTVFDYSQRSKYDTQMSVWSTGANFADVIHVHIHI